MYEEFKKAPNYQAMQDNQINKIIAAQQRRYNPSLLGNVYQEKPTNLYQQYLNQTGMMKDEKSLREEEMYNPNINNNQRNFLKNEDNQEIFDPTNIKNQALPEMPRHDFYAGKPNPELPKSVYSKHINKPEPSKYGKPMHNFAEKIDYKLTSKNDDYSYVDTYEMDKKRAHQNYSNILGRKLGDPSTRPEENKPKFEADVFGLPQKNGTMEQQRKQKGVKSRRDRNDRLFPSMHYTEFKDNRPQKIIQDPNRPQDMESRTDRMIQALRQNQEQESESEPEPEM